MRTPPGGVERLEDRDVVAAADELLGGGQAGRPGPHDRDAPPGRRRVRRRLRLGVDHRPVGNVALQGADRDRRALLGPDADALALDLLRADPARDAGEGVVAEQRFRCAGHVADPQQLDETRDVDADGAARDAHRVLALQAALGLEDRELLRVAEVDLAEVGRALERVLLGHVGPLDGHPLLRRERTVERRLELRVAAGRCVCRLAGGRGRLVGHARASPAATAASSCSACSASAGIRQLPVGAWMGASSCGSAGVSAARRRATSRACASNSR